MRYKKILVVGIFLLFFGTTIFPSTNCNITKKNDLKSNSWYEDIESIINESLLDLRLIRNITENLSNIIFTEYNESAGELAKGRAFGTKGEWKGAKILAENMTKFGLWTKKVPINKTEDRPRLASFLQIHDRNLVVTNTTTNISVLVSDCYISPRRNLTFLITELDKLKATNPISALIFGIILKFIGFYCGGFKDLNNIYDYVRLSHNFSYKNLSIKLRPYNYSFIGDLTNFTENKYEEPYVYIDLERTFSTYPKKHINYNGIFYKTLSKICSFTGLSNKYLESIIWTISYPNCMGLILVNSENDTYNMGGSGSCTVPLIRVNNTIGYDMYNNYEDYKIDFYINQSWNESVLSYNVIGQLNGTNPDETVIVCGLYDSWWCQGTGDAAIGISTVLGIAKYFQDNNIKPKCNVKFIAFGGEERGIRGASYYEFNHSKENITHFIDINQIGFTPLFPERIKFQIWPNNKELNDTIGLFAEDTDYTERTGVKFQTICKKDGGPSNTAPFSQNRICNTLLFLKTGVDVPGPDWLNHHKDGLNHTAGDVIDHFNWTDTSVTGEMIWNVTKYFTINPDSCLENCSFIITDSSVEEDDLPDSINASFTIKTSIPSDLVMINASLIEKGTGRNVFNKKVSYIVNSIGFKNTITLTLPKTEEEGWYRCKLSLYNSTGRINQLWNIDGSNSNDNCTSLYYYLYPE